MSFSTAGGIFCVSSDIVFSGLWRSVGGPRYCAMQHSVATATVNLDCAPQHSYRRGFFFRLFFSSSSSRRSEATSSPVVGGAGAFRGGGGDHPWPLIPNARGS